MSEISTTIGYNMRSIRKVRGITQQQLADTIAQITGEFVSASIIGAWQRAERRISAEYLLIIADVLRVSVVQLYGRHESLQVIHHLSQHEQQIVRYAFDVWDGDVHPLLQLMGLYMALDRSIRAQVVDDAMRVFRQARANGKLNRTTYAVDTAFISRKERQIE